MAGFFKKEVLHDPNKGKRYSCLTCGLARNCASPKMEPSGKGQVPILHIGQAPDEHEDAKGIQFVSRYGKYYDRISKQSGTSIHDGIKTYACDCWPVDEKDEEPTDDQIQACRKRVFKVVHDFKPKVVFLLGGFALKSYLGNRLSSSPGSIQKWRGYQIPDYDNNCWVIPMFHPTFVLNMKKRNPAAEVIFRQDIENGLAKLNEELPPPIPMDNVRVLLNDSDIESALREILHVNPEYLAFDWEATGLRPLMKGHKTWSVGICHNPDEAIAFHCHSITRQNKRLLKKVLAADSKKIAHNLKMEDRWSLFLFGEDVITNWFLDTMVESHVLNNEPYTTSLKFQSMVHFGVWDYSSEVTPYLIGHGPHGANNINRIHEAPQKKLLKYNAQDALLTYHLGMKQIKEIGI